MTNHGDAFGAARERTEGTSAQLHRLHGMAGYSLMELLTVVSILGALGAMTLPHIDTRRQDIQSVTAQVVADYRWARTRAITSGDHFGITWTNGGSAYRVNRLKQSAAGVWEVQAVAREVVLPNHITAPGIPPPAEFNTRGVLVSATAPIQLSLQDTQFQTSRALRVWPSGQVYAED